MIPGMFERAALLERLNRAFAVVTIISTSGAVPRKSARMLVEEDGAVTSTIGGHLIERQAAAEAVKAIRRGSGGVVEVENGRSGGRISLMIDVVNPVRRAYILGFGNVGRSIAQVLHSVGYEIHIYDAAGADCPFACEVRVGPWDEILSGLTVDEYSALVVTCHDWESLLQKTDCSRAFYVGAISSRARVIPRKGLSVPMGLDIGGESPEEIAVAVAAEIMRACSRHSGQSLSRRRERLVIVRGAGDLATATIIKLSRAGYDVLALETQEPTQVRRNVSFAEAVYEGRHSVDGLEAVRIDSLEDAFRAFDSGLVPVLVDPQGESIARLHPAVVVDAIIAKRNLGTRIDMAPLTIALGPGFTAGTDVDVVIETQRGHNLGRIIRSGQAAANTGVPGIIAGYGAERVVRSSCGGIFRGLRTFGDIVRKGDVIAYVCDQPQTAPIDGMIRGMLHSGLSVPEGFKIADIDPRGEGIEYDSPSDKARCIAGAVLEAVDSFFASQPI